MKKLLLILLLITFTFFSYGCQDRSELEEQAYVVVIGMDYYDENSILVTYQIANPQGGGGNAAGKTAEEPAADNVTVKAPDIVVARDTVGAFVTRTITFSHVNTLLVGEELAKSDMFFRQLESAIRDKQMRRSTFFVVTKEPAYKFIDNNKPTLETRPHKFYELMSRRWDDTALVGISTIHRFVKRVEGDEGIYLSIYGASKKDEVKEDAHEDEYLAGEIYRFSGDPAEMIGSGVFKEGKMIGTLTGEETRMVMFLRPSETIDSVLNTYPDPLDDDYRITLKFIKQNKTKINIDVSKDIPIIDVTVPIDIEIVSIHSMKDYVTDAENRKILENHIEEKAKEKMEKLIQKVQKDFKGDPFQWHNVAKKKFKTNKEYREYDWMKSFPSASVSVKVEIEIVGFGKQLEPPKPPRIKD